MQELLAKGMINAENAVLSGCSAGGLASLMHCDSFRALLPMGTKVKCLSDAGFFLNTRDVSGVQYIKTYFEDVVTLHGSAKNLPRSCTSRLTPAMVESIHVIIIKPFFVSLQYFYPYNQSPKICSVSFRNMWLARLELLCSFLMPLMTLGR
jgi:hypothetical protein